MEKGKETSFERMNMAVQKIVKEDLGVDVACCKSHASATLKVIACPEQVDTVEVYVPYQIFVGAKTVGACAEWSVDYWASALKQLSFEFGVKNYLRTCLMSRNVRGISPRTYAGSFWKSIESMAKWKIELPESQDASVILARITPETVTTISVKENGEIQVSEEYDIKAAYNLFGMDLACS